MTTPAAARERRDQTMRIVLPIIVFALILGAWELVVRWFNIPP